MKIMIVVTHLLGTGHLARALMIARAFKDQGHDTMLISGGMPAPHLQRTDILCQQLPPVRSDGTNFATLLDESSNPVTDALLQNRATTLRTLFDQHQPDVLITELFPFGRRILRAEFTDLLAYAKAQRVPPLICASIRDILAPPSKPKKSDYANTMVQQYYDAVLCHGDPQITPLELSWPVADQWRDKLHYTGFVPAAPENTQSPAGRNEILVSAGGGNVGRTLFATAAKAARRDPDRTWRLLFGGSEAQTDITKLTSSAPSNVILEPARPDFRSMLPQVACSVSLCGYNTALDVLRAGCPAVFIPFDAGNEVEQTLRASALSQQNGIEIVMNAELTPALLYQKVLEASSAPKRAPLTDALDGATTTVQQVAQLREAQDAG